MPTVKVISPFKHWGEIVPSGSILDVPDDVLPKLVGLIEPLDPFKLVGERLAEIDRQGRPWTGFMQTLTPADRQQLRDAEAAIDRAVLENDCDATVKALDKYQRLLAALRCRLH